MEWILLGFAVPMLAIALRRHVQARERTLVFARDHALPWYERGEFTFTLSGDGEARMRACLQRVRGDGLTARLEPTGVAGRYRAVWSIRARSSGRWYRDLCERILAAAAAEGIEPATILSSTGAPGGGPQVMLDNISFAGGTDPAPR